MQVEQRKAVKLSIYKLMYSVGYSVIVIMLYLLKTKDKLP